MTNRLPAPGIPDDAFARGAVPMTKMEVRAIALAKARLRPDARVLDVGAGTGGLAIDAAAHCAAGEIVAVERDAEALGLLRTNAASLGAANLTVVAGEAPAAFEGLEGRFDAVLVGGSGGRLRAIVDALPALLAPGGRVVLNAVGLASVSSAMEVLGAEPWTGLECVQVSVSRAEMLGPDVRFVPLNPVWIVSAVLPEAVTP